MRPFVRSPLTALFTLWFCTSTFAGSKETKKNDAKLEVPLPIGQKAKTLVFPFYNPEGRLQMNFEIGVALRMDEERMHMTHAIIETFNEEGAQDLKIILPKSTLNLETKVITSDGDVTIERSDFRLTGEGLNFNTQTRKGTLTGDIEMLIYDRNTKVN